MKTILLLIAFFLSLIGQASAQSSSIFTNNINLSAGVPFTFPTGMPINTTSPVILGSPTVGATLVALPGRWTNQDHVTVPIDGTYNLIFDEEFNGSSLDATKWNPNWFGATATSVTTSTGPSSQSASDPAQNTVAGGFFALTTLSNPITIGANSFPYRSGHADSNPVGGNASPGFQFNPTSGNPAYFEARMYVPPAPSGFVANWPSFWATGQNWPVTGEIDVAEGLTPGEMWANYHSSPGAQNSGFLGSNYTGWHVFAALWTTSTVTYYYDGVQVEQYTTGIASAPLFLVMDQMMNPSEGGPNVVPATVLFDYVHVYLKGGTPVASQANYGGAEATFSGGYTYQWNRAGTPIPGATGPTYVTASGDAGAALTVSVTATNGLGASQPAKSAPINIAGGGVPVNTAPPTISGFVSGTTPEVNHQLTAANGTWTNNPTSFSYQWYSSGVAGKFSVSSSGQIIAPNGKPFVARGIVFRFVSDLPTAMPNLPSTAPLTTAFPGINFVRLFYAPSEMPFATLQTYINALTAAGIVVELQDAAAGEFSTNFCVLTGSALTTSTNLMATYAAAYINNPYVWFVSQNEPDLFNLGDTSAGCTGSGSYNLVPITTEQLAYYNAVRGTGNNNIFIVSTAGSAKFEVFPPAVASQYAGLTNAIWETHYYNFISNFSTDVATNLADLNDIVSNHQAVPFAAGTPPVCICEYGNSTDGANIDAGWMATITAINTDSTPVVGSAAWGWHTGGSGGADQLQNSPYNGTSLTAYGTLVAQYIASGPSPPSPALAPGAIVGATSQTYTPVAGVAGNTLTVSVTASNASGASPAATSAATSAVIP